MADDVKTEFNSNLSTLERVDRLLRFCTVASYEENLTSWFKHLENLRREAIVKMKHDKKKTGECKENCILCNLQTDFTELRRKNELYKSIRNDTAIHNKFKGLLDDFEMALRQFMNDKGMLLRDGKTGMERFLS